MRGFGLGILVLIALEVGLSTPRVADNLGPAASAVGKWLSRLSDPTVPGIWQHSAAVTNMGPLNPGGGGGGGSPAHVSPASTTPGPVIVNT